MKKVTVMTNLLKANDLIALENKEIYQKSGNLTINLLGSPGSGKTTLLQSTIEKVGGESVAIIEGDLYTDIDARKFEGTGAQVVQLNTQGACHLDAGMVKAALPKLDLNHTDLLFIENVGNLVCPASFDLGEHLRVVVLSVPEGDDKPAKYMPMFNFVDVVLITKTDLIPFCDFDVARATGDAKKINQKLEIFEVSAKTGEGIDRWVEYLKEGLNGI